MCGIVGVAGDISLLVRDTVFKDMLDVCQVRGRDSTGVLKVTDKLSYDWVKQVGSPSYLYDGKAYQNRIEKGIAYALVGHTRAKTHGEVSRDNAHPFDIEDLGICGVHNGTLRNHHKLDGYAYSKVDSEVLYNHLAINGPKATFEELEGSFACVWWDDNEKTLNFIRNTERPLWFTWSKDKKMMFWASERWMFGAVSRKVDIWEGAGKKKEVYVELPPNTLWSFKINKDAKAGESPLTLMSKKLPEPEKPKSVYQSVYGETWRRTGEGAAVRVVKNAVETQQEGGEVANPFQQQLDDKIPWPLYNKKKEEIILPADQKSTSLNNVEFLKNSNSCSEQQKQQKNTTKSQEKKTSLSSKNLENSQSKDKEEKLDNLLMFTGNSKKLQKVSRCRKPLISFRKVANLDFITDNLTHNEYNVEELMKNTMGTCSHCKTILNTQYQIGAVMSKESFICRNCLEEPSTGVI